ncbi:hypothetical protein PC9H_006477 [Pleurotus ostreatus]|uniref:Uncharacterized protein n=2 Tax=Pleurotus ostreatus TaxID=5322 RepID=A0A067NFY8_PLEO1|nr:uncharacterized protein PC9H_006477 [Pleurotus ostreatus]KAF7430766.1 hypothetical protein PC9H_006477 [Pleurotus ostreatus]KDQ26759.1 hypothetical protein PLEOSDRAFT_1089861 [Pleurotus ostreatus PC15]
MRNFIVSLIIVATAVTASHIPIPRNERSANHSAVDSPTSLADGQDDPQPTCSPVGHPCTPIRCCPGLSCVGFHAYPGSACIVCPPGWIC